MSALGSAWPSMANMEPSNVHARAPLRRMSDQNGHREPGAKYALPPQRRVATAISVARCETAAAACSRLVR